MAEKPQLEESTQSPLCPACQAPLRKLHWHKGRGGPMSISDLVLLSWMVGPVAA